MTADAKRASDGGDNKEIMSIGRFPLRDLRDLPQLYDERKLKLKAAAHPTSVPTHNHLLRVCDGMKHVQRLITA